MVLSSRSLATSPVGASPLSYPLIVVKSSDAPLPSNLEGRYLSSLGHRVDRLLRQLEQRRSFFDRQDLVVRHACSPDPAEAIAWFRAKDSIRTYSILSKEKGQPKKSRHSEPGIAWGPAITIDEQDTAASRYRLSTKPFEPSSVEALAVNQGPVLSPRSPLRRARSTPRRGGRGARRDLRERGAENKRRGAGGGKARENWPFYDEAPAVADRGSCKPPSPPELVGDFDWLRQTDSNRQPSG